MSKYWNLSAPISVHVEVTEACNEKCRHCYNFSRCDSYVPKTISIENLDYTIDELVKNNVMHVIITGGEPLLALDRTVYLAEKALNALISYDCHQAEKYAKTAISSLELARQSGENLAVFHDVLNAIPRIVEEVFVGSKCGEANDTEGLYKAIENVSKLYLEYIEKFSI